MDAYQTVPRPRWQQCLRRVIAIGFIAAISSAITVGILIWANEKPLPALIADLQGSDADISRAFQQRLEQRFPAGTPETDLIREIAGQFPAEGFVPTWNWTPTVHTATYGRSTFPCREDWTVTWRIDEQHHISNAHGWYQRACL